MPATDQWIRKCSLFVMAGADPSAGTDKGLDLSNFRIRFQTHQADPIAKRPPWAIIRVTNLAPETEKKFINEYSSVVLQAGYENGKFGIIFRGTIKQYRRGHESATDSYLNIYASDGDMSWVNGVINKTFPAGWTNAHKQQAAFDAAAQYGLQKGYIGTGISQDAMKALGRNIRGTSIWGMMHKSLTETTRQAGETWTISHGKINIVPLNGYLPGEAVKLSGATGLIGWPEQTQGGIDVTCLLNPAIRCGNLVQIDNKAINYSKAAGGKTAAGKTIAGGGLRVEGFPGLGDVFFLQPVTDDGYYRVILVEHQGDTRGNDWFTKLTCLAIDISQVADLAKGGQAGVDDIKIPVPPPVADWGGLPKGDQSDVPENVTEIQPI